VAKDFPKDHQVKLFRLVLSTKRTDFVATNDMAQDSTQDTQDVCALRWKIEQFHRELKQLTGSEKCQCRKARSQRNHLGYCYLAWLSLKVRSTQLNLSLYQVRQHIFDDFLTAVRYNMDRAAPPGVFQDITVDRKIWLELGGMCSMDRPVEEFTFCDLTIRVPSEDLSDLVARWLVAPAVSVLDQEFHRFTSWPWKCLVVDSRQRSDLLYLLTTRVDLAARRAARFWADRESPQEILRKYNESKGVVIPYGPDKIDRFRS
jgi:hypothetical protein